MNTGEPQRSFSESQRAMNSQRDSRSRFWPKYSSGSDFSPTPEPGEPSGVSGFSFFLSCSMIRLKPVPTGSTKTRSANASQDDSFWTSCGGSVGNVPSAGKETRWGPTAPMCRYAEDAPGPPLKTNATGLLGSLPSATYETEKISAAGFSFFRRTSHFAVAV